MTGFLAEKAYQKLLREDLGSFIARTFLTVDPSSTFLPNWHIDLIADRLQQASEGKITRLIINMPPRALKSVCVSVAWPAWLLGHNPATRIMAASYSQALSLKHSLDTRLVLNAPWYQWLFPEVKLVRDQNEKAKFVTTRRGFRFATSVGGTATGEGGDILIMDDPHNPAQAASDVQRRHAIDWFDQTFMSRLNNKKKGVVVVVMQRLHVEDLTGHLLERGGNHWHQLILPAVAPVRQVYVYNGKKRRKVYKEGEFLHPEREGRAEIERTREELGSYAFAAQYQQQPILLEGGMIQAAWLKRYREAPAAGKIIQSWDTAMKTGQNSDYSVCATWCETENAHYLLDVFAARLEYPDLKRTLINQAERWQPEAVLIEDKASGQSLLQDMRRETSLPVLAIRPQQDKVARLAAVSAMVEAGRVFLPHHAPWLAEFEAELLSFPQVVHDDRVDAFSQYLNWVRGRSSLAPRIRRL